MFLDYFVLWVLIALALIPLYWIVAIHDILCEATMHRHHPRQEWRVA
jgi:hypothetical protein